MLLGFDLAARDAGRHHHDFQASQGAASRQRAPFQAFDAASQIHWVAFTVVEIKYLEVEGPVMRGPLESMSLQPRWRIRAAVFVTTLAVVAHAQVMEKWRKPDGSLYVGNNPPGGSTKIGEVGSNARPAISEARESSPGLLVTIDRSSIQPYLSRAVIKVENAGHDYYGSLVLKCAALAGTKRISPLEVFISGDQYGPWRPGFWMKRELMFSSGKESVSGFTCVAHGTPADAETAPKLTQHGE